MSRMLPLVTLVLGLAVASTTASADAPVKAAIDSATIDLSRFTGFDGDTTHVEDRDGKVVVVSVTAGGTWEAFGLKKGDVLVAIGGENIDAAGQLAAQGRMLLMDDVAYVEVLRKSKPLLLRRVVTGRPAPVPPATDAELDALVTHLGGTRWEVDADALFADPMKFAKGARVVPSIKNGKPNGFKLYAIRPSSVYARLGLQNGDTIVSLNGMSVETADKALEVYGKVREADAVVVEIIRRGKPVTQTYVRKRPATP